MAARDRYTHKITCDGCGQAGVLHISEDDYPFMKNLHREIDKVEGDFVATVDKNNAITVVCSQCKHTLNPRP